MLNLKQQQQEQHTKPILWFSTIFFTLTPSPYHHSYWIFLFYFELSMRAPKLTFQLIVVSMLGTFILLSEWICSGFRFFFYFVVSLEHISLFPLLLQQTDDSNYVLRISVCMCVAYSAHYIQFLSFVVALFVLHSVVLLRLILDVIAVSYAKNIKCTWDWEIFCFGFFFRSFFSPLLLRSVLLLTVNCSQMVSRTVIYVHKLKDKWKNTNDSFRVFFFTLIQPSSDCDSFIPWL